MNLPGVEGKQGAERDVNAAKKKREGRQRKTVRSLGTLRILRFVLLTVTVILQTLLYKGNIKETLTTL